MEIEKEIHRGRRREKRREKKSCFQLHVCCVENRSLFISFKFEIKILLTFWLLFAATVKLSPHQKIFFHIIVFSITLCMSFLTTSINFLFVLSSFCIFSIFLSEQIIPLLHKYLKQLIFIPLNKLPKCPTKAVSLKCSLLVLSILDTHKSQHLELGPLQQLYSQLNFKGRTKFSRNKFYALEKCQLLIGHQPYLNT